MKNLTLQNELGDPRYGLHDNWVGAFLNENVCEYKFCTGFSTPRQTKKKTCVCTTLGIPTRLNSRY